MTDDEELLFKLHQLRDIFSEERERRIRDDDVGLHHQFNALGRAEVAIALQLVDADLLRIGNAVSVPVSVINERDCALAVVLREEVRRLVLVARRDEPLQTQRLELIGEVVEEVGDARIVAVAKHGLAAEVLLVVSKLPLDIRELRVELVLFRLFRVIQQVVRHIIFLDSVAMRLHRGGTEDRRLQKRARPRSMPALEALGGPCSSHGEDAPGAGASCKMDEHKANCGFV